MDVHSHKFIPIHKISFTKLIRRQHEDLFANNSIGIDKYKPSSDDISVEKEENDENYQSFPDSVK